LEDGRKTGIVVFVEENVIVRIPPTIIYCTWCGWNLALATFTIDPCLLKYPW